MRQRTWLRRLLVTAILLVPACQVLDAYKASMSIDPDTGRVRAELKGASQGGQFNENTGLNMTMGDNTVSGLIIAGVLGAGVIFAYPLQRGLRKRRERGVEREWKENEQRQKPPPDK